MNGEEVDMDLSAMEYDMTSHLSQYIVQEFS